VVFAELQPHLAERDRIIVVTCEPCSKPWRVPPVTGLSMAERSAHHEAMAPPAASAAVAPAVTGQ